MTETLIGVLMSSITFVPLAFHPQPTTVLSNRSGSSAVSPPCRLFSSSMLYSLGLSLGAPHCVHVLGMADRPDLFTKRFYPPSFSAQSLTTPGWLAVHLYAHSIAFRHVRVFHSSVRRTFPPWTARTVPWTFALERVFRGEATHINTRNTQAFTECPPTKDRRQETGVDECR